MHRYKRIKKVSQGAFGTVYQYQNLQPTQQISSHTVAIKEVYTSSQNVKRQLEILKDLPQHPNLLKVYEIIDEKFHTQIVMQLGKYDLGGYIDQAAYPLQEKEVKKVVYQLLNGLKVLHEKGYIHRDLKPCNIIITPTGLAKLCDFGSAVKCTQGQEYELEGFTRWYKAPQMLYGCRNYKYEVDIWSLGCIIMQFATGQPYFDGKSEIQQLSLITQQLGNPTKQNWPSMSKLPDFGKITFKTMPQKTIEQISTQRGISMELSAFIKRMIRYDNRSSVEELLSDPFLKQVSEQNERLELPSQDQERLTVEVRESLEGLKKLLRQEIKKC